MSATTIGLVVDRVNSVCAAQGFKQSTDHFDFDVLPSERLDRGYIVQSARVGTEGQLGAVQIERHRITVFVCRKIGRDQFGAVRQLKSDLDIIEGVLIDDHTLHHYYVNDDAVTNSVQTPVDPKAAHVVARLDAIVELERSI
jgi:hypothetical protein